MQPEALASAQDSDASALDTASASDAEAFLARAKETAMEKLRRRRRVQKRREEKAAVASSPPPLGKAAAEAAREAPPVHSERLSNPKRCVPRLRLRAIVTPGRPVPPARVDGEPLPPPDVASPTFASKKVTSNVIAERKRAGVTAAVAVGDAVVCGTEDGDVVAYRSRTDAAAVSSDGVSREASMRCPGACGDAGPARLIRAVVANRGDETPASSTARCVVAYDSGAWCVFAMRPSRDARSGDDAGDADGFRLTLIAACPPHVAFSDAYKYRKRAPWAPARRPSAGAVLVDARGETLFVASPVVGDANVYAWDIGPVSRNVSGEIRGGSRSDREHAASPTDAGRIAAMRKHADKVTCLAFLDERETRVISGGNDKALVEWRREGEDAFPETIRDGSADASSSGLSSGPASRPGESTWVAARRVVAPGGAIRALCVSRSIGGPAGDARAGKDAPADARVYTAGSDGAVRAWDLSNETGFVLLRTFLGGHAGFGARVFAVRLPGSSVSARDAAEDSLEAFEAFEASEESEEYVLSGSEGAAGGFWVEGDGSLKLWRAADGLCAQTVRAQSGDISAIVRLQDARVGRGRDAGLVARLAVASTDGTVAHFDLDATRRAPSPRRGDGFAAAGDDASAGVDGDGRPASFAWTRGFL